MAKGICELCKQEKRLHKYFDKIFYKNIYICRECDPTPINNTEKSSNRSPYYGIWRSDDK